MDKVDVKLLRMLLTDPRMSFRELSDKLGISTPAVHRRIQMAIEQGVAREAVAHISLPYLRGIFLVVYGRSKSDNLAHTLKELSKNDRTSAVMVCSGMFLYVYGVLHGIEEMDRYVSFVKKCTEMQDAEVAIPGGDDSGCSSAPKEGELPTLLDLKIIKSLHKSGRKGVNEIADELGVSTKTVSRRLERMKGNGMIDIELTIDAAASGFMVAFLHIRPKEGVDKHELRKRIIANHFPPLTSVFTYSNMPGLLIAPCWVDNMLELNKALDKLEREEGVKSVMPHIHISVHYFDSWVDELTADPQRALEELRK